jgi:hypothetical protein
MSVLASLLTGEGLGTEGARLLYDTVRKVGTARNFPPPEGFQRWNTDAVATCAHEFLTGTRATERLVQLAVLASDDASFERLLTASVRNFLRDQARRTVVGALVRRLKDVAGESGVFVVSGDQISLATGPNSLFGGDDADLVRAAMRVDVRTRRWRPDADRQGPLASRDNMIELMQTVLVAADGALDFATLARVIARRYDLDPLPAVEAVDVLDPHALSDFGAVQVGDQANPIIDQLTEVERRVLPLLDMSCREAAQHLPYGHSTVAKAQASLRAMLQQVLPAGSEGAALLRVITESLASEEQSSDSS